MNALQQALHDMGSTAQEVADTLKQAGIKGRRQSCENCPIARYLDLLGYACPQVGLESGINAGNRAIFRYIDEPHTEATEGFIRQFDKGEFPGLEGL